MRQLQRVLPGLSRTIRACVAHNRERTSRSVPAFGDVAATIALMPGIKAS